MAFLEVRRIVKSFGGLKALDDVSLSVEKGEIRAIIGPNGAGKSTLFNVMTGLLAPDAGEVLFDGERISGVPPHRVTRKGIGRSFQITNIFPRMSVFENVQVALFSHHGNSRAPLSLARKYGEVADEVHAILGQVGMAEKFDTSASVLSHGDQKRLEIAITLACRPKLLMLDEPTAGMSRFESRDTIALLQKISREQGLTLVFTEHDMGIVFGISERIMVLQQGAVIADGTPAEIKADPEVRKAYLGEEIAE
ncbi:MAG: ABC transporter ATP-binding protein [Deltaproteobacteria bacterium GWC2_65_14]|nr:MAG: ABC transporter ATP-binding protein [Deltaproteobacteria bacterium GWC2_65_14]